MLKAMRAWIRSNKGWLSPETAVLTELLLSLAKAMDEQQPVPPGLAGAYLRAYSDLKKLKPSDTENDSDEDDLLSPGEEF